MFYCLSHVYAYATYLIWGYFLSGYTFSFIYINTLSDIVWLVFDKYHVNNMVAHIERDDRVIYALQNVKIYF